MKYKLGATRFVLLAGRFAIKVPYMYSWRTFLNGLLGNMQESEFSRTRWPELCPVVFSVYGGLFLVMRRAEPLSEAQWLCMHPEWKIRPEYVVPVEMKRDSFGILDGRIVAIDYGS